jgi:heat shock protein beta
LGINTAPVFVSQVIYFTDPVDEYLMQYLMDYEDKKFQNVSKEGLKLGKDSKLKELKESFKELTDWWKKVLESENVDSVKISNRLDNTPCVVVTSKYGWSANMEKIMQAQTLSDSSKQAYMRGKRVLEINPRHPIIKELRDKVAQDAEVLNIFLPKAFCRSTNNGMKTMVTKQFVYTNRLRI